MRVLPRLLAILGLFGPLAGHRPENAQAFAGARESLQVMTLLDGLILDWQVPGIELDQQADGSVLVEIPGYAQLGQPGTPRLPFTAVFIAIPPGSTPAVEVLEIEEKNLPLPGPLALGNVPEGVFRAADGTVVGGRFIPSSRVVPFDPEPVIVEMVGIVRGVHLARVAFYPARTEGENLRVATKLKVAVRFEEVSPRGLRDETGLDPLLLALQSAVANPEHVQTDSRPTHPSPQVAQITETGQNLAAVEVERRGLTSITYEALAEAGIPVTGFDPRNLRVIRSGVEIPYEWEGDGDSQFEPGESLLFYASPRFSRWTSVDVYFLSDGGTPSPPISTRSAGPAGLPAGNAVVDALFEQNQIYTPDCYCAPIPPGRDGDRWVWDNLNLTSKPDAQYEFELSSVDEGQPGSLTVWLVGYTDTGANPDHRVTVTLNGTSLGELNWDGKQAVSETLTIPAGVLESGANTMSLSLPGITGVSVEGAWLDAFSVRFSRDTTGTGNDLLFSGEEDPHSYLLALESVSGLRAYDVSDPQAPLRLTGLEIQAGNTISLGDPAGLGNRTYYVANESGISTPVQVRKVNFLESGGDFSGADYLVIAHPDFIPALAELLALRQEQGWVVHVESTQAIFDAYGEGRPEPIAIHEYLKTAYDTWGIRPLYVLLIGDGTYDPRRYLASSSETFLPPFLAEVDPWAGETAADNRYVTLEGEDNLPDLLIGRLPVNSPAEAQTVVDKIVRYETQPAPGSWPGNGIVAADDPDDGGDFPFIAETVLDPLSASAIDPQRFYYLPTQTSADQVRQGILSAWNQGSAVNLYAGHASIHQWGVEAFLHLEDVNGLHNGARLPLVLEMTCFTGSYHIPGFPTLDEALIRHPEGGAIATWGATGLGIATGHATLAETFLERAVSLGDDLGTAALAGKLAMAIQNPDHLDLVDTFTLLGDPATKLNLTVGNDLFYLPLIQQ